VSEAIVIKAKNIAISYDNIPLITDFSTIRQKSGEKIYQLLFEAGDYTKSYEEFVQQYGNVEKSKALYKGLNDVGDYTKSFEEFTSQYGFNDEVKKRLILNIKFVTILYGIPEKMVKVKNLIPLNANTFRSQKFPHRFPATKMQFSS
jgi:hypothetical protein